tara:strand:- start:215 stop:1144 length:930 start_codon:yes stop_codon:yes gene_type:complete
MYPDNSWYGQRAILTKYCESPDRNVFATIQHGWVPEYEMRNINIASRKLLSAPFLSWGENMKSVYGLKANIIPIGSPFIYLDKIIERKEIKSKGTIFFPSHSVVGSDDGVHGKLKFSTNHHHIIEELIKTAEPPFTVSLYYVDYEDEEVRKIYQSYGWKVVSFGNRDDKKFLTNVYHEIMKNNLFVCTDISSALLYAIFLKKKVKFLNRVIVDGKEIEISRSDEHDSIIPTNNPNIVKNLRDEIPEVFKDFSFNDKILKFALNQLGETNLKNRKDLKKILGIDSRLKIISANLYKKIISTNHFIRRLIK